MPEEYSIGSTTCKSVCSCVGSYHAKSGPQLLVPPIQVYWKIWAPETKISDLFGPFWNILSSFEFASNTICKGEIIYFTWNIWFSMQST